MNYQKPLLALFVFLLISVGTILAQNIAINTNGNLPDTSAALDISSTNKGLLIPRMTTTQMNAIPLPAAGLLIFNTTTSAVSVNTGTSASPIWVSVALANAAGWGLTGNAGTSASTNFIGTTDAVDFVTKTNNTERMRVSSGGNFAIGTATFDATNPEKFLVDAGTTTSVNAMYLKGTINSYLQINLSNKSTGTQASSDIVATANNGTETTNFIDLGINGGGFVYQSGNPIETGKFNDGYLLSAGNDMYMVNNNATKSMIFLTGGTATANERMRILYNGRVGIGLSDPNNPLAVKDSMEIRRVGTLSQLLFTNTAGTGDFRIGGDGGDIYWQGGGGRSLQMGSYWATVLGGDRQSSSFPSHVAGISGTGVLVQAQRSASVPLAIQGAASQTSNLTEWRNSSGTVLSIVNTTGQFGIGTTSANSTLSVGGSITVGFRSVSGATTIAATDYIVLNTGGSGTWTLPTISGCTGRVYKLINHGTTSITLSTGYKADNGGILITTLSSAAASNMIEIISDGTNWRLIR